MKDYENSRFVEKVVDTLRKVYYVEYLFEIAPYQTMFTHKKGLELIIRIKGFLGKRIATVFFEGRKVTMKADRHYGFLKGKVREVIQTLNEQEFKRYYQVAIQA